MSTGAVLLSALLVLSQSGCGGDKAFTKGSYDDPTRVELLDDKFNEADMQQMADTVVKEVVACDYVMKSAKPPVVIVTKVQNRTEEHIDTQSITDKVATALIKTAKVRFLDKSARGDIEDEYSYGEGGNVDPVTAKRRGKQMGADYILNGAISTNIQQVGNDKYIYYKLNVNLTNLETSTIDCPVEKELRKKFRKRSVGL